MQITLPGSKSLSNRVLLLSALSKGTTTVENLLDSADIRYMLGALKQLNVKSSICLHHIDCMQIDLFF
jgi:3-phosphoshikimate 1-carboxyvinyltransferase